MTLQKKYFKTRAKSSPFFNIIENNEPFLTFTVFLFFLLFNGIMYFTVSNVSSPDDQWFYFKIADLFRTEGWSAISNFQGAYFTDLAQSGYGYGVGLYHYFLMPFTLFSDKILGLKLSGLFFASLVPTMSWCVLRKLNIKKSLIWVILFFYALASFNFTFRLFLNRPFVLIDVLMLIEIYLISRKKYHSLFFVSLIHTWWHPATFWLPIMLAICFEIAKALHQKKIDFKNVVTALIGSLGAFLLFPAHSHTFLSPLNPIYFIKNLFSFIYGLGNGPRLIEGGENYKGDIFGMLVQSNIVFAFLIFLVVLNIILYIYRRNNDDKDIDPDNERAVLREYVFLVTIIVFLGFVFSKRFEDLLVPITLLGSAVSFQLLWDNEYFKINNLAVKKAFIWSLAIFILIAGGNRILDLRNSIGSDQAFLKYERVGNWLKNNTEKNEIIFNTDFGQFNRLFFYNSWNRYIVGIEPKNMYEFSQEHYWLWHNITLSGVAYEKGNYAEIETAQKGAEGKSEDELEKIMVENARNIAPVIKNTFKSQYIFFDGDRYLRKELEKDPEDYNLVYSNKEDGTYVYKINK